MKTLAFFRLISSAESAGGVPLGSSRVLEADLGVEGVVADSGLVTVDFEPAG